MGRRGDPDARTDAGAAMGAAARAGAGARVSDGADAEAGKGGCAAGVRAWTRAAASAGGGTAGAARARAGAGCRSRLRPGATGIAVAELRGPPSCEETVEAVMLVGAEAAKAVHALVLPPPTPPAAGDDAGGGLLGWRSMSASICWRSADCAGRAQ
jgi:hypothetical protein